MPTLSAEPRSGSELEDFVAAMFQAAGYFVEKNIIERDPLDVLELDIVATDYSTIQPESILVEAKGGDWGFTEVFKIIGWMQYLEVRQSALFVSRDVPDRDPTWVNSKVGHLGLRVVDLQDMSNAAATFQAAGFNHIIEPNEVHMWRWSHIIERKMLAIPGNVIRRGRGSLEGAKAVREYHGLVNNGIFFTRDVRDRVVSLYEAYQAHPKLSAACAREAAGQPFDPAAATPLGDNTMREALLDGAHPLVQASLYVEQRARLALLKAAVDLAAQHPEVIARLQARSPGGFRYLVLPQLPATYRSGLEWLSKQPSFQRFPLLWQLFLWGLGGFYLQDRRDEEFAWLSSRSGIPVEEVPVALEAFDRFFPIGEWMTTSGNTQCRTTKMMPAAFRGLGAFVRGVFYSWETPGQAPYDDYTANDLGRWNALATDLVT